MISCSSSNAGRACSSVKMSKSVLPMTESGVAQAVPIGHRPAHPDEPAVLVLEVDAVRDRVEQAVEQVALERRLLLRALPLQELPDLAADGGESAEQVVVRFLDRRG